MQSPEISGGKTTLSQRIRYIDLMETVAMLFVVAYHLSNLSYKPMDTPTWEASLNYYLRSFFVCCVPLFLVTNGYLLFHHSFDLKRHLKKTVKYVILTLIWAVLTQLSANKANGISQGWGDFITAILTWREDVIYLWYMGALTIIYLLFPLLKLVYDHNRKLLIYFCVMLSVFTFGNRLLNHLMTVFYYMKGTQLGWVLMENWFSMFNPVAEIPGYTLVYFCLGAFLEDFIRWVEKFPRKRTCSLAVMGLILAGVVHAAGFALLCKATGSYICGLWYGYETITGFVISLCAIVLLKNYRGTWKPGAKLLTLISSNTLGIYFMHMVLVHPLRELVYPISALCNLPMNLILSAAVIAVCLGITLILKKIPVVKHLVS